MGLSEEQRRKIQREEEQRHEEERYRLKVRSEIENPPEPRPARSGPRLGRVLLALLILGFILYVVMQNSK